ncbi:MAG: Ig-like domain-containing protein [Bacteroidales bacterium]|nr:Ig-like domain-containing protein [Bacteroidales bacterium]
MKKILSRYFPLIPAAVVLALSVFSHSCANTTQAPTGGVRDTIPPVIRKVKPEPGATHVPVKGAQIVFTFDEYVVVKDPKSIYLSPPQKKAPKYKLKGKSLVVWFEEELLPDMTYTLDLTGAVVDNHESNPFPGFTTWFSTGSVIDSMYLTGSVYDCTNLKPIKGATVMLYKDHRDSAVFLQRPIASVKTDDWGYFSIRNIKDTLFRAYALIDANNNNIYDPEEDRIAFLDTLIKPIHVVDEEAPELQKYDMKDTTSCLSRKSDISMYVFRERPSKQVLMNSKRTGDRSAYITFRAPDARIDSLWFRGFPPSKVITEFNISQDSLLLWINDSRKMPDTLFLYVNYWKTDSLGVLVPVTEDLKLVDENKPKGKQAKKKLEHKDTVCAITLKAEQESFEVDGISMTFADPPFMGDFESLSLTSVSPKQIEQPEKFTIERDSLNLRRYVITPQVKYLQGYEYVFKVPHRSFRDIAGHWNDSTQVKFSLPTSEELSSFTLKVTGVDRRYIIEMLDEKKTKTIRRYVIDGDKDLFFPYLAKGKYCVRITEDVNKNGMVDTGNVLMHKQPEMVRFLRTNDSDTFDIPERSEIVQELDIKAFISQ